MHRVVMGAGPDLIIIHGASATTREFTNGFAQKLSQQFRVILLDRPGYGHSAPRSPAEVAPFSRAYCSLSDQATVLRCAVSDLGVTNPIILGHSYGAAVALKWVLENPKGVAGLVVLSGVSNPWPGNIDWYYRINGSFLGGAFLPPMICALTPQKRIDDTIKCVFRPNSVPTGYADHIGPRQILRRQSLRANARQVFNLRPQIDKMHHDYGDLALPVEILHGDADPILPMEIHAVPLSKQIKDANFTILPGVGHMPHQTHPDAVEQAILSVAVRSGLISHT